MKYCLMILNDVWKLVVEEIIIAYSHILKYSLDTRLQAQMQTIFETCLFKWSLYSVRKDIRIIT